MALSYFDKAVIFFLPIIVLTFFQDKAEYLSVEFIYSVSIVIIPFLDLGLVNYFYYVYRQKEGGAQIISKINNIYRLVFLSAFALGGGFIVIHYTVYPINDLIVFIIFRSLFLSAVAFLSSYYRLLNKPQNVLYVTILTNAVSLGVLLLYLFSDSSFELWTLFIGQILFCLVYMFKIIWDTYKTRINLRILEIRTTISASLRFSWPTILQVFIMMYLANYGKIHAMDNLNINDGVLLSLVQRLAMLIFLTHSSLLAFFIRDIYIEKNHKTINISLFSRYFFLLLITLLLIGSAIVGYLVVWENESLFSRSVLISLLLIGYTFISCMFSYFELYYGRENKNIIRLILALIMAGIFILLFNFIQTELLLKLSASMFLSALISFLLSLGILYKRNYKFA